ncbi:MAG: hypothetical protein WAL98_00490 [Desulfatiglandaceae bacterium]
MSENMQIILAIFFLVGVYILTRYGITWRIRRASLFIIRDLEKRKALDPESAVELPYGKKELFKVGIRDYKPRALESLIHDGVLGKTENGMYYLKRRLEDLRSNIQ